VGVGEMNTHPKPPPMVIYLLVLHMYPMVIYEFPAGGPNDSGLVLYMNLPTIKDSLNKLTGFINTHCNIWILPRPLG